MRVKEGNTILEVPEGSLESRDPSDSSVFYNPLMESNRDISVAVVSTLQKSRNRKLEFIDVHSATGARGVRIANEIDNIKVILNDWSKEAQEYIKKNTNLNSVDVDIKNRKANTILSDNKFDLIDLDPFGSPVPFLDSAFRSINHKGIISLTATDTALLCGAQVKPCIRRYTARPLRTPYHKEIGSRILIGKCIRIGAQYDKAIQPLLTYYKNHYFRVYFSVVEGAHKSNTLIDKIGFLYHCFGCGKRNLRLGLTPEKGKGIYTCRCGESFKVAGPLYTGKLGNKNFLEKVLNEIKDIRLKTREEDIELISKIIKEVDMPPFFYDIHKFCKLLSITAPKNKEILKMLREKGFYAVESHYEPTGIKTNASLEDFKGVLFELARNKNSKSA